jgi:phage terminase large subunit
MGRGKSWGNEMSGKTKSDTLNIAKWFYMGLELGCAIDQLENFARAGVWLQPKQLEFCAAARLCDGNNGKNPILTVYPKDIMAGGGRGAAKTHGILAQIFCDDCQRRDELKFLILRKVGRANKEQIQDFRKKLLFNIPHNYREQASSITFDKTGSLVILGNFKDEKDIDKYLGLEYDGIHIVESNQITMTKKTNILSCLRTNKPDWTPRCYEDTNPGGINHVGNKQIFVDGKWAWDGVKYVKIGEENETRYIHYTIDDNKFVNPGYKEYLEKLVGWQREAWLHGSWEFMAGAFFSNFHLDTHVYPNPQTDLNLRAVVRWFAGLDYGYSHPTAFTLGCQTEDGDIFCVTNYKEANTLIEEHSSNIRDILSLYGIEISDLEFIAAGRDCFRMDKDGSTVATEYQENGIMLTPVHIDRINAWSQVAEVFGDVQRQIRPRCFIHQNCEDLIFQIQSAQSDPKKPNDILKVNCDPETLEGGDDLLEAFRNMIVMSYSTLLQNAKPIQFGGWKGLSAPILEIGYTSTDAVIAEMEAADEARRN